jgi:hypothetical protein
VETNRWTNRRLTWRYNGYLGVLGDFAEAFEAFSTIAYKLRSCWYFNNTTPICTWPAVVSQECDNSWLSVCPWELSRICRGGFGVPSLLPLARQAIASFEAPEDRHDEGLKMAARGGTATTLLHPLASFE